MFPQLFQIGHLSVPTYGVLVALGVFTGLWISVRYARKIGVNPDHAWNFGIIIVLGGVVGAKILYVLVDLQAYAQHPREIFSLDTLRAGGVFSGGVIAALVAGIWYIRRHHLPALGILDAFAPGLALGHAIGRLGCFSAGCCWGKPTDHFWGVTFTNPLAHELVGTPLGVALQPTQLFEAAVELANFFLLAWLWKRKKFDGQIVATYLMVYGVARYFLEFIRDDPGRGSVFGGVMSGTQLIAIFMLVGGGLIWWWRSAFIAVPAEAATHS